MMFPLVYQELPPPADLARWVACFWQITGGSASEFSFSHRVLPDGCADLLFDINSIRGTGGTPAELVGPMSNAHVLELRGAIEKLIMPRRKTFYGSIEAGYADPAGNVVIFAERHTA